MADDQDQTRTPDANAKKLVNGAIWSVPLLLLVAFLMGIGAVIATQDMVRWTQDNTYCGSACHSMGRVAKEHEASLHGTNSRGVRADCQDCHIPHDYPAVFFYKARSALRDVVQEVRGVIKTDEQFEQERLRLARSVWEEYRDNDSAHCRQCHVFSNEVIAKQKPTAQPAHQKLERPDATCIDCHRGVAHVAPLE
ncbi:MAG: NapC/NirT family cytochrome c [Rhodocyclaceae bacterium]